MSDHAVLSMATLVVRLAALATAGATQLTLVVPLPPLAAQPRLRNWSGSGAPSALVSLMVVMVAVCGERPLTRAVHTTVMVTRRATCLHLSRRSGWSSDAPGGAFAQMPSSIKRCGCRVEGTSQPPAAARPGVLLDR